MRPPGQGGPPGRRRQQIVGISRCPDLSAVAGSRGGGGIPGRRCRSGRTRFAGHYGATEMSPRRRHRSLPEAFPMRQETDTPDPNPFLS